MCVLSYTILNFNLRIWYIYIYTLHPAKSILCQHSLCEKKTVHCLYFQLMLNDSRPNALLRLQFPKIWIITICNLLLTIANYRIWDTLKYGVNQFSITTRHDTDWIWSPLYSAWDPKWTNVLWFGTRCRLV